MALALIAFAAGCSSEPEPELPWEEFPISGVVVELKDGDPAVAVIDHEEIEGFMGAMTMGFPVREAEEMAKMSEGDRIEGVIRARGHLEYYLDDVTVLPAEADAADEPESEQ